jgi:hypothetical protein
VSGGTAADHAVCDSVAAAPSSDRPEGSSDMSESSTEKLRYRVLTGADDRAFCERISAALDDGYVLHGGPAVTFDGNRVIVAQAIVLRDAEVPATS